MKRFYTTAENIFTPSYKFAMIFQLKTENAHVGGGVEKLPSALITFCAHHT